MAGTLAASPGCSHRHLRRPGLHGLDFGIGVTFGGKVSRPVARIHDVCVPRTEAGARTDTLILLLISARSAASVPETDLAWRALRGMNAKVW